MKKFLTALVLLFLLSANVVIFAQTVKISDDIVKLETRTGTLKKDNARLEQRVYAQNSIANLEELAKGLGFTKQSEPLFLDSQEYALIP
ncbi:hypothetical protein A3I56_05115 [Candidatus Roizmanbacteria bacterium RIFCSPLOWO2_02_FULL_43_10]|uniref:Cell division protein FtsL n=2 Tax=Candidatus Roizmaniibacteriota TaxID=1752723 RepID=A0A1F7JVF3_9BACT|nr:MAG: hypothetical protein A3D08_00535 [Candidatus Roizmanbacteria bacterium RIFCSPHIGHO2_02_FULL_43_11]OGK59609.1 MAG: hypothetical protein A3I56_05115 [Candidatus Roizmanbacteria bacterium RIFCSPLOWO2_02_FULL_43_10]